MKPSLFQIRRYSTLTKDKYPNISRGNYAYVLDTDMQYFSSLLDSNQIVTDTHELKSYNNDWFGIVCGYSSVVLKPKSTEEVAAILKYCNNRKLAVCPQGGNTGLVGGSVPVFDEVVVSSSSMNEILTFNDVSGVLNCQSGCILQNLMNYVEKRSFIMPLDLGAKGSCHIGGNVSTNAGGLRLLRYGSLQSTILGLEVVLADGTVLDCMNTLKKDNTGYHLKHLFIGSEGTLGFVTKVAVQCAPLPKATNLALLGVQNFEKVLDVYKLAQSNLAEILSSLEMMDHTAVITVKENTGISCPIPDMPFYILIETSGSENTHDEEKLEKFLEACFKKHLICDGFSTSEPSKMKVLWNIREAIPSAVLKDGYAYKYDISLPLNSFYDIVTDLKTRLKNMPDLIRICGYGHLGDGNIHVNLTSSQFSLNLLNQIEPYIYQRISEMRGSISAEHGIGFMKRKYLKYSKTDNEILMMKQFKQLLDPNMILNPLKIF